MQASEVDEQPSRKQFKQAVSSLPRDKLISLVVDLCAVSPDVRRFLEAKFALVAPLVPFKKIIDNALNPDVMKGNAPISFADARKAIRDYSKATGDEKGTLELMIYAVECGNDFTVQYGDIDERFYNNLESLFRKTVLALKKMDRQTVDEFLPRLQAVVEAAHGIGWGYYDGIADALAAAFPPD